MKVRDLIAELEKLPNKDAEVLVQHWMLATRTDKVILNYTKVKGILRKVDGSVDSVLIDSGKIEEDI